MSEYSARLFVSGSLLVPSAEKTVPSQVSGFGSHVDILLTPDLDPPSFPITVPACLSVCLCVCICASLCCLHCSHFNLNLEG